MWIAERAGVGDVVVKGDNSLAAKCVKAEAQVLEFNSEMLTQTNIGTVLAIRDFLIDFRATDPFCQCGGKGFTKVDQSRFLNA